MYVCIYTYIHVNIFRIYVLQESYDKYKKKKKNTYIVSKSIRCLFRSDCKSRIESILRVMFSNKIFLKRYCTYIIGVFYHDNIIVGYSINIGPKC